MEHTNILIGCQLIVDHNIPIKCLVEKCGGTVVRRLTPEEFKKMCLDMGWGFISIRDL